MCPRIFTQSTQAHAPRRVVGRKLSFKYTFNSFSNPHSLRSAIFCTSLKFNNEVENGGELRLKRRYGKNVAPREGCVQNAVLLLRTLAGAPCLRVYGRARTIFKLYIIIRSPWKGGSNARTKSSWTARRFGSSSWTKRNYRLFVPTDSYCARCAKL